MKAFVLAFIILCFGCLLIESVNLNCEFKPGDFAVINTAYACNAHKQGYIITDSLNRHVTTISRSTNSDPSVKAVHILFSNCFYFPLGLEIFFTNLEAILVVGSKLREIKSEDFKEYKNLRVINLNKNEIQFLEPNLFEFVPKLEGIFLQSNNIAHIDANVFDNFVDKLSYLFLGGNVCEFVNAYDDKSKANQIIEKVKSGSCQDISKLPTTTTTTTTTTQDPTTTTPAPLPTVTLAQFEALMEEVKELKIKVEASDAKLNNLENTKVNSKNCCADGDFEGRLAFIEKSVGFDKDYHKTS